jgi:propanol-preferring alcohol dehydrogenase
MKAMALKRVADLQDNRFPLEMMEYPDPVPGKKEILIRVSVCGVCHTEIDEIEGRMPHLKLPLIPGHQVVGKVVERGEEATKFEEGARVGIGWIYRACGGCSCCLSGRENLCEQFQATGRDVHGGYAEYIQIPEDFAYSIPDVFSDAEAAPLLCAGAIGYRSLKLAGLKNGDNLGLTGFGASAHLTLKLTRHLYPRSRIFVFARSAKERHFAGELGAHWAGSTEEESPEKLDGIIDTTPVWKPVIHALLNLRRGGKLIINAIQKEDTDKEELLKLNYAGHLWLEKEIKTVANVTRGDISEFLEIAAAVPLKPEFQEFALKEANKALIELKEGKIRGAKVLRVASQ